jgi:hypothetical protein
MGKFAAFAFTAVAELHFISTARNLVLPPEHALADGE